MSQQCQVNYTAAGVRAQGTTGMSVTSGDGAWPYADLFRADGLLYIESNLWDVMYPQSSNHKIAGVDDEFSRWGGKVRVRI